MSEENGLKLTREKAAIHKDLEKLNAENSKLKEKINEETESSPGRNDISKYKEFLKRAQDEYKSLQNEHKKENEKHRNELEQISLKRLETEGRYGQVVKEKELYREKEKIYMETFDALTRLNKIIKENDKKEPVIDITGEEN